MSSEVVDLHMEGEILVAKVKVKIMTKAIAEKIVDARLSFVNNSKFFLLSDIRTVSEVPKDAREFFGSERGCEGVLAAAILVSSSVGSMIANFFMKINKPAVPTKLFTEEEPAKKWLKEQMVLK